MLSATKTKVLGLLLVALALPSGAAVWPGLGAQQPQTALQPIAHPAPEQGPRAQRQTEVVATEPPTGPITVSEGEADPRAGRNSLPQAPAPEPAARPSYPGPLATVSPDGKLVAVLRDNEVRVLVTDSGKELMRLSMGTSGNKQYTADMRTGRILSSEDSPAPRGLEFTQDGTHLLCRTGPAPVNARGDHRPAAEKKVVAGTALRTLLQIDDPEIHDLTTKLLQRLAERHDRTMHSAAQAKPDVPARAGLPQAAPASPSNEQLQRQIDQLTRELADLKRQLDKSGR